MTKQELLDKANDLPLAPGVYLMMDKTGCVIYVGKAKKLKNRVSQYFQENSSHNEKTRRMVSQVDHFDTIFVSTEFEALILENSLIKQHMPRYNILLKDDKGYPFVRLGTEHYPRFTMASKPADDNALYFGPFGGRNETRAAIDAICAAFRLPTCSRKFPRDIGKERPCLNHHMGRCDAFCRGTPDEDEYMRRIGQAEELLNGHYRRLTRALREEMGQEAADLHFEQAAALRDRIRAIEVLGKRQKVIAGICADTDIWGVYRGALKCGSAVLHIEDGSVTGRDLNLFAAPQDESEQMILSALLPQYYLNKSVLPREILLPCEIEGAAELAQILTERAGRKVTLHVPQRGEKAELLAMAQRNAREDVERVTTAQERENRTLTQLAGMLSLSEPPRRMESYDISNTGASDIVASMVVYEGAKPKKSAYRRFKIKSLSAHPDDYASMEEVLTRRIQRYLDGDEKFSPLPDVMLIDGGITHAGVAERVCAQMHVRVPIFGMVKDDRHRTRALVTAQGREIDLHAAPNVFALIGQIQEETHRFAITFHHESHSRSSTRSALDGIPGVGKVRAQAAQERENRTLTQLAGMLSLSEPPRRMESYDISNTGASDIVASMVVYEGAKPKKSAYRRFKIKSLSAHPDDYASMEEVLTRRIQRYLDGDEKFSPLPDVMLIDGGITHAGVAERVCAQMHVRVPIFGMVKDDRHRTRALVTAQGREIDLHAAPNVFALIGQIQEETHRFAITFHHESHSRSSTRSALDGIPGVGKVRAQALLKTFKSVRAIREADIFALERVLPKDAAASVYLHFHGETDEKKDEM